MSRVLSVFVPVFYSHEVMDFVTLPKVGLPYLHLHSVSHAALSLKYVWLPSFPCHIIRLRASCTAAAVPLEVEHVCKVYPYIRVWYRLSVAPLSFVPFSVHSLHLLYRWQEVSQSTVRAQISPCCICKPYLFPAPSLRRRTTRLLCAHQATTKLRFRASLLAEFTCGLRGDPVTKQTTLVAGYPRRMTSE